MTEQKQDKTRRCSSLPTSMGIDLLVKWANQGPASLVPASRGPNDTWAQGERSHVMRRLRRTAESLGLGQPHELESVHGRDFGDLSPGLLADLARLARIRGYVTPGCRERVPMSPVQVDGIYRLVWGSTYEQIARETGVSPTGVSSAVRRARREHGCETTPQLMACVFRNRWLPDQEELRFLLSGRMVWNLPPTVAGPGDKPPYLWTDHS